jgi:hypothetical protein
MLRNQLINIEIFRNYRKTNGEWLRVLNEVTVSSDTCFKRLLDTLKNELERSKIIEKFKCNDNNLGQIYF